MRTSTRGRPDPSSPCDLHGTHSHRHVCAHTERASLLGTIVMLKDKRWIFYSANAVSLLYDGCSSLLSQSVGNHDRHSPLPARQPPATDTGQKRRLVDYSRQVDDGRLSPLFRLSRGATVKLTWGFWAACFSSSQVGTGWHPSSWSSIRWMTARPQQAFPILVNLKKGD